MTTSSTCSCCAIPYGPHFMAASSLTLCGTQRDAISSIPLALTQVHETDVTQHSSPPRLPPPCRGQHRLRAVHLRSARHEPRGLHSDRPQCHAAWALLLPQQVRQRGCVIPEKAREGAVLHLNRSHRKPCFTSTGQARGHTSPQQARQVAAGAAGSPCQLEGAGHSTRRFCSR